MELKDLILAFSKKWKVIATFSIVFGVIGIFCYFAWPVKYIATGSVFVSRSVARVGEFDDFTYEGYYAKLTSGEYAKTVIGLLESRDIHSKVLMVFINDNPAVSAVFTPSSAQLNRFKRNVSVKKVSPQLISVSVKAPSISAAFVTWNTLVGEVVNASSDLNSIAGDPMLEVTFVEGSPVVTEVYRNLWLNLGVGISLGAVLGLFYVSFREYLK